jgi:DtxR family Mn-dependent transcriptional regulator
MNSITEENYLKAIYILSMEGAASTNAIAERLQTKASSVTDMAKKLSEKNLVHYQKYQGIQLKPAGLSIALKVIRKHRLWEVFLVDTLNFKWDEVHDIAEQLEHINSIELTKRLDAFLSFPKFDPHGDPIPDADGKITERNTSKLLSELTVKDAGIIVGVKNSDTSFLQYLESQQLILGTPIELVQYFDFDRSMVISTKDRNLTLSHQVSKNLIIKQ